MLTGRRRSTPPFIRSVMLAALFLSFSRAAWGQFAFAAALLLAVSFATLPLRSRPPERR